MLNLDKFRQLFNPLPGNHYLHVSTCRDEITELFQEMMIVVDGELNTAYYNEDNLQFNQPFRARPRDHDMLVLKDVFFKHENPDMLLKLSYLTLANTAHVIILEKKGLLDIKEVEDKLEKFEFRVASSIDLIDGYDLIMAKKMHMWGNGL